MGLFLDVSGVIGASSAEVQGALNKYAEENKREFKLEKGTTDDQDIGVITREGEKTTILYPSGFDNSDDDVSQFISKELCRTVFSFHIHDALCYRSPIISCGADEIDAGWCGWRWTPVENPACGDECAVCRRHLLMSIL